MTLPHFVLTRSVYGDAWPLDANRRRVALLGGITARTLAAQSEPFVWIVLVDAADPLAELRRAAIESAGVPHLIVPWTPPAAPAAAPWDKHAATTTPAQRIAASAYRAPWAEAMGPRPNGALVTRIDDDDGFAPDAFARIRQAVRRGGATGRVAWILPYGIRVWDGREEPVRHTTNAMSTLQTPPGDAATVYDYGHRRVAEYCPVRFVDSRPGWLWVRHRDTISGHKRASRPLSAGTRALFPIAWELLR